MPTEAATRSPSWPSTSIDHFKVINDAHGHPVGDTVLRAVAQALDEVARRDETVGRLGGEEFAVILPMCDGAAAMTIAERLRAGVATVPLARGSLSCSAGVAVYPTDAVDAVALVELADGALYWAKRSGRNQTPPYDPEHVTTRSVEEQRSQVLALLPRNDRSTPRSNPSSTSPAVGSSATRRWPASRAGERPTSGSRAPAVRDSRRHWRQRRYRRHSTPTLAPTATSP